LFSYTIQIQDLFLFIYIFIYFLWKTRSSVSVFNLFLANINTALQPANFEFRNAMQIPSGMLTGPVQADFPVLISTLFALLLSNL